MGFGKAPQVPAAPTPPSLSSTLSQTNMSMKANSTGNLGGTFLTGAKMASAPATVAPKTLLGQ